jgi:putative DNA primase/helicase
VNATPNVMRSAQKYIQAGISIIPIKRDGSKRPPLKEWNPYRERLATDTELREWFGRNAPCGIATVCGPVSGNLEVMDFDEEADVIFPQWRALVEAEASGLIARLSAVRTPRMPSGFHLRYRTGGITPVTTKIATSENGKVTLIETRGEGGYAIAPGSPADCHENKVEYQPVEGPPAWDPPTITPEERTILWRCAASFDRRNDEEGGKTLKGKKDGQILPGDDYCERGPDWSEILIGWELIRQVGDCCYWRRPGKDGKNWSATTGRCKNQKSHDLLAVFSTNAHPFPGPRAGKLCSVHTRFQAFALLHHGGDFTAAAMALRELGYGSPGNPKVPNAEQPITPVLVCMADVKSRPVEWLWPGRIALGKLTLIAGDPGLGKSFVALDLAARISRGTPWPDAPDSSAPLGGVIILTAEDDLEDTVRPRLDAAGADVRRITALAAVKHNYKEKPREVVFSLATDLPALEAALQAISDCKLVIIDPITAYLGGDTDSHNNGEIRGLLAPLAALATKYGVAVVLVTHLSKNPNVPAIYRSIGSIAFTAAARAVWGVCKDKKNKRRRFFLPIKCNLSLDTLGMAYFLEPTANGIPIVGWEPEPVDLSADEAEAEDDDDNQAKAWIQEALKDGPMPAADLLVQGRANGFTHKAIRQVFHDIGGQRKKIGFQGQWQWWLPTTVAESLPPLESLKKAEESLTDLRSEDAQESLDSSKGDKDAKDSDDGWEIVA